MIKLYKKLTIKQLTLIILLWVFTVLIIVGLLPLFSIVEPIYFQYSKFLLGVGCLGILSWGIGLWGKDWDLPDSNG